MPKKIDPELRARAVRLVREHQDQYPTITDAVKAVARQLAVSNESVRRWLVQADVDDGARPGVTSAESAEIRKLRAENKRLREDVEILRAATVFFAGELDPRNH
jgi:transposase